MLYIYILELESNKYYIGKTTNPEYRLETHYDGDGSAWTHKYKPIKLIEIFGGCDNFDEDKYTLKYMEKYGINNVRGGSFCEIILNQENINTIKRMITGSTDKCFICGKSGHFVSDCEDNICYEDVWTCEYCNKEFMDKNKCKSHENNCKSKSTDYTDFKKEFISNCKIYDKLNNNIIQGDEIIKGLKKTDKSFDFKLSNIYGLCQQINNCEELIPVLSYRNGINFINFIDGLIYFIKKNTIKENKSKSQSKSNTNNYTCYRCGRAGHKSTECYAKTNIDGDDLDSSSDSDSDSDDYDEIFCCDNCGKEYDTFKGLTCHQNLYCKKSKSNTNISNKKTNKNSYKNCCYRCGREGHLKEDCYASRHVKGYNI